MIFLTGLLLAVVNMIVLGLQFAGLIHLPWLQLSLVLMDNLILVLIVWLRLDGGIEFIDTLRFLLFVIAMTPPIYLFLAYLATLYSGMEVLLLLLTAIEIILILRSEPQLESHQQLKVLLFVFVILPLPSYFVWFARILDPIVIDLFMILPLLGMQLLLSGVGWYIEEAAKIHIVDQQELYQQPSD